MQEPDILERLQDILDAIGKIEGFTAGKNLDDLREDAMLDMAVQRCIEIISEASRCIPGEVKAKHDEIPWRNIAGIGNVLRHGYHSIDHSVLWSVVTDDLQPLKQAVVLMKAEHDA